MIDLPLSRTLDPADFDQLAEELQLVDRYFTRDREQHPMRRWEYALALRARSTWQDGRDYRFPRREVDVGGAGSPFWRMLSNTVQVIDPEENQTLEHYLTAIDSQPKLFDAVFCLSVLEHVEDLGRFMYHLSCLVAPGGLLFLTFDYCDGYAKAAGPNQLAEVPDVYHFHWMRRRIFNIFTLNHLIRICDRWGLEPLGPVDHTWSGAHVYDYTFASLAIVKRA